MYRARIRANPCLIRALSGPGTDAPDARIRHGFRARIHGLGPTDSAILDHGFSGRLLIPVTPADSGPLRKTPWICSYGKQVADLTELCGSWNVAYIYNKESLCKASQRHHKGLLLGRATCRWITICYYKVRWFLIKRL